MQRCVPSLFGFTSFTDVGILIHEMCQLGKSVSYVASFLIVKIYIWKVLINLQEVLKEVKVKLTINYIYLEFFGNQNYLGNLNRLQESLTQRIN